jgi:hypothetical protein
VKNRTDLMRKQREHGFPRPIKIADRQDRAPWPSLPACGAARS